MSRVQLPHSYPKIIFHALTRKLSAESEFSPTAIRVNGFYCRPRQLEQFTKAFCHPNELPSFAFVATFKLVLQCISQSNMPSNLTGLIHLQSDYQITKPHNWLLPTDVEVTLKEVRKDEKGLNYLIVTKLYQNGEITLININRMLDKDIHYRPNRVAEERKSTYQIGSTLTSTVVSTKTAWRYAFMSSDYNPIHLSSVLARQLGLKRSLIHGMFNVHFGLSHILKTVEESPTSIKVQFNKPCFLPSQVFLRGYEGIDSFGLFGRDKAERFVKIDLDYEPNN